MFIRRIKVRQREGGMSMIELIMAMTLLAVGMAGVMILISSAISSNNRNKLDTTATVLSQMMTERLVAAGAKASASFTITDCQSNSLTVDPSGTTSGSGAALSGTAIDFSTAPTPTSGYSVNYQTCGTGANAATYNIRWHVKILQGTNTDPFTKEIIVATRQVGAGGTGPNQLKFFAPPVTLRTVIGR
jgi:prepilin-type N-terminal cleavage/methylation domain-containing protein